MVFFCLFVLVLNIFYSYTEGVQWLFQRKLLFSKVSEGGPTFSRGGVQMLISIETHIICVFLGGSGPPIPPLDLHIVACSSSIKYADRYDV